MHSCFYEGTIRHRRFVPVRHEFEYPLFLVYVDLAELDELFGGHGLWSSSAPAVARFRRADHLGDPSRPLDEQVRDLVESRLGWRPDGPIRLLTNFRYFAFEMNPVSLYYCFEGQGRRLVAIVAEVNNTPWGEQHCYVLEGDPSPDATGDGGTLTARSPKEFHVSPFLPLDIEYRWRLSVPGSRLAVHIDNHDDGAKLFDATLSLSRTPINRRTRVEILIRYPLLTLRTFAAIYWQAFRLWRKRVPFVPHPRSMPSTDIARSGAVATNAPPLAESLDRGQREELHL
jgi:DUF1365 family protein